MRVAINLLTDDPANTSGAHWFWTRVIPEMSKRLSDNEEWHLRVSPRPRKPPENSGSGGVVDGAGQGVSTGAIVAGSATFRADMYAAATDHVFALFSPSVNVRRGIVAAVRHGYWKPYFCAKTSAAST